MRLYLYKILYGCIVLTHLYHIIIHCVLSPRGCRFVVLFECTIKYIILYYIIVPICMPIFRRNFKNCRFTWFKKKRNVTSANLTIGRGTMGWITAYML